jgi:lipopolysaccharide export LptBFGC system permease protein LptF
MKFSIKKILVIALSIIFLFAIAVLLVGLYIVKDWSKVKTENVNCSKTDLVKLKDVEGNTFVFSDTAENSNLKTNNITFNEKNLGIKSLAKINNTNPSINYLSKNDKLTYDELKNLQDCYKVEIMISNNYNFEKAQDNKFCNFVLKRGESYEITTCE